MIILREIKIKFMIESNGKLKVVDMNNLFP